MKKKILSFLLCLCMVAVLLPTTALAAPADTPVENVTFKYAYDVQRTPAFPSKVGNNIKLWDLAAPKNSNGNTDGMQNNGSWTLTRVGTYSYVKGNVNDDKLNSTYLESIVTSVATKYSISDKKDTIVIHELKNGNNHIAYGVVIAYSATEEMAVFVGDLWNASGAGYLLSKNEITDDPVTVTAGTIATDFVKQTASIALDPAEDYTFPAATEGYGEQAPLTVTVNNTGNVDTGLLNITLSGDNADSFTVEETVIGNIGTDSNGAPFQVKPITGLAAGTYTATVTVGGTNVASRSIGVSFTVNPASQSTPVVIIVPDDTTNTADPAKNPETGDNSTHLLWAVMASSALCAAALLFSSRRRGEEMQ